MKAKTVYGYIIPVLVAAVFLVLIGIAALNILYKSPSYNADIMSQDIEKLQEILEHIDQTCKIIDFDQQQSIINFLNIKKDGFVGSEVGPVNLAYPEKWEGPYLEDNPTMQEKEYMVVRTEQGYFITPGNGVQLPNSKTIGINLILDEKADISTLMHEENGLMYQGKSLAAPLTIGATASRREVQEVLPTD